MKDPRRAEWRTPRDFWAVIDKEFNFDIDVAATPENALCRMNSTKQGDTLRAAHSWFPFVGGGILSGIGVEKKRFLAAYCNPPFGNMTEWITKARSEVAATKGSVAVVLCRCAPSTNWWKAACAGDAKLAVEIRLLKPRVNFEPPPGIQATGGNDQEMAMFVFRHRRFVEDHVDLIINNWEWRQPKARRKRKGK